MVKKMEIAEPYLIFLKKYSLHIIPSVMYYNNAQWKYCELS